MIGKAIGLLAVMTAAIVVVPVQIVLMIYRRHQRKKDSKAADDTRGRAIPATRPTYRRKGTRLVNIDGRIWT